MPTVVAVGGRGAATATGDLLFARAFAELSANGRADEIQVLSEASSALAEGELLQRADAWNAEVSLERYLRRCELKTARLFEAACRLGALEGGGAPEELGAFGRRIGLAFQLLDDVLDVSGPAERTGKQRGTDLLDGTVTLPFILARERDAGLAALDPRVDRLRGRGRGRLRPHRGDGRARRGARPRAGDGQRGQGRAAGRAVGAPAPRARARRDGRRGALRLACGQPQGDSGARARDGRVRAWHAVSVNGDRTSYDVWGAAIAVEAALSLLLVPRPRLHLGADRRRLLLAEVGGLRRSRCRSRSSSRSASRCGRPRAACARSRSMARRRAGSRPCSSTVYALAGGGTFWPLWAVATLGLAFGAHAIVVAALPSLRPQERQLAARVDELTRTRAGALDVQAAELRRIERDLHDGAQARLVALSMQLGRAEERLDDRPEVAELVRGAREEAGAAIGELRDLARGIAPPVLADRGLVAAVEALGQRAPIPVTVQASILRRPAAGGRDRRLLRRGRGADQRRQARRRRGRDGRARRPRRPARRRGPRRGPGRRRRRPAPG